MSVSFSCDASCEYSFDRRLFRPTWTLTTSSFEHGLRPFSFFPSPDQLRSVKASVAKRLICLFWKESSSVVYSSVSMLSSSTPSSVYDFVHSSTECVPLCSA